MKKNRLYELVIITGLLIILLQIYILPKPDPYMDLTLVQPDNNEFVLASSAHVQNNSTVIYPFVKNQMENSLLVNFSIQVHTVKPQKNVLPSGRGILPNVTTTYTLPYYDSNTQIGEWEIRPWRVNNIYTNNSYLSLTLYYYENDNWKQYDWVGLKLVFDA